MPTNADVVYNLKGDASDLNRALQGVQGSLDSVADASQATGNVAAKALDKGVGGGAKGAQATVGKLDEALKKAGSTAGKQFSSNVGQAKEAVAQLGSAVSVISPQLGGLVMQASALSGALKAASVAGVSMAGVALVGVGLAAAAAGGAILGLVSAASDWAKELDKIRGVDLITNAQLSALTKAKAAMTGIGTEAKVAGVILASELAPSVEFVATAAIAAELAVNDWLLNLQKGEGIIRTVTADLVDFTVHGLLGPIDAMFGWGRAVEMVARAGGMDSLADSLSTIRNGYHDLVGGIGESVGAWAAQGGELVKLTVASSDYWKQAEGIVGMEEHRADATKEVGKASKEAAEGVRELTEAERERNMLRGESGMEKQWEARKQADKEAMSATETLLEITTSANAELLSQKDQILLAQNAELENIDKLVKAGGDAAAAEEARAAVAAQTIRDLTELRIAENQALFDVYTSTAETFFNGVSSLAMWASETAAKGNAATAARWLGFWKGAAITETIISGVVAAQNAFKSLSGIPYVGPVLGAVAAAGVAATTAANVAKIESTEMPSYEIGGADTGGHYAMLHGTPSRPEYVLSARDVEGMGGVSGVERTKRGEAGTVVLVTPDYSILARGVANEDRRNSVITRSTRGKHGRMSDL